MLKGTHDPWITRRLHKGANTDLDPEELPDGYARDMLNMRPTSTGGETGAASKIKGDIVTASDEGAPGSYKCIGTFEAGGRRCAFWASTDLAEAPILRIDGTTMASSPNIPYTWDRPLQIAVKDIGGGIAFPADGNAPPLYWDIPAIVAAFFGGLPTYFGAYTTTVNSVGLLVPPQFPKFTGLDDVGGTGGLLPGLYAYAIRYVTGVGDRTNIGPFTPLIAVPYNLSINGVPTSVMPGTRNYGGPATTIATRYAPHLKIRVDNYAGFDSIEVVRVRFNDGAGLTGAGIVEVVGRIDIADNQFSVEDFVDPSDSNTLELIPDDEEVLQQLLINAPKGAEFTDNRLIYANFDTLPQKIDITFREVGGDKAFPFTSKVTTNNGGTLVPGTYSDPLNFTYKRTFARGEQYGFAIAPWNGLNGPMPAIPIPGYETYQFPNRREEKSGDSLTYSDDPCTACNVSHGITATFEAITQGTAKKTDDTSVVNISPYTWRNLAENWLTAGPIPPDVTWTSGMVGLDPAAKDISYTTLHPTGNTDFGNTPNWNYIVNGSVASGSATVPVYDPYRPEGFAPVPQALGLGIYGVENIPSYVNAFTVARTQPAGRIVAQGLFCYDLYEVGSGVPSQKYANRGRFFSPDMLNGIVDQATIDDIIANPTSYQLQFVAPLGFLSEVFSHFRSTDATPFGVAQHGVFMDMISYARILHDAGEINPFDDVPIGASGYVDWGRWRSTATTGGFGGTSYWHSPGQDGNSLLDITSAGFGTPSPRAPDHFLHITTNQYCYRENSVVAGELFADPTSDQVRRFHEPWYVVNIIRTGAVASSDNITKYVPTSTTIMMESCVGIYDGTIGGVQTFPLLNERPDDVRGFLPTDFRYIYVGGEPWVCFTGNSFFLVPANFATVLTDIASGGWTSPDGKIVKGVYAYDSTNNAVIVGSLQTPSDGARITVRYDSTAPILALGGDRTIDPAIFSYYDSTGISGQGPDAITGAKLNGLPMPFRGFISNPRFLLVDNTSGLSYSEAIRTDVSNLRSIRQWVVMFDCECLAPLNYATNLNSATACEDKNQFYGAVNYVPRPYTCFVSGSATDNGLYVNYEQSYPFEISSSTVLYGGFRFMQKVNPDYAHGERIAFASVPAVGFQEKTDFPCGVVWSAKSDPLKVDLPGLRTFTSQNLHVISEETGEIKTIYVLNGGGAQNLYGRTERGAFKLLTNKNVLTGASGETIGTQATDVFIGPTGEIWLSRSIGSPGETWVCSAKGTALAGSGYADSAWWFDRNAAYRQIGDQIVDISTGRYATKLRQMVLGQNGEAFDHRYAAGFFDPVYQEWQFIAATRPNPITLTRRMFAYSNQTGEWCGEYTYDHDRFLSIGGRTFGFKGRKDYQTDIGYLLDGSPYTCWAEAAYSQPDGMRKEAVRFRENTNVSPTRIEIYDENGVMMTFTDAATFGQYWIKFIDSYEQNVSRNMATYDPQRKRPQARFFFKRSIHDLEEAFVLNDSSLQLHQIR